MSNQLKKYGIIGIVLLLFIGAYVLFTNKETNQSDQNLFPAQSITHGHGLAVDVANSSKVYIATHHGLLVLINDKDLYAVGKSRDDYMGFSPNPKEAKVFFSSGHPETGGNIGFQKSEDGGATWKKVSNGLEGPVDFHAMAVSPINSNLIFGWYRGNLQRSEDGGKNWLKFATSVPFVALAGDTKDENIVYAASPAGLFKSQNKGESWERLIEGFVAAVAVSPKDNQILLVSSEKLGIVKSTDAGKTWQKIDQGFNGESPLFIAFDKQKPETLYILTEKNSIYKSIDEGTSWSKIR